MIPIVAVRTSLKEAFVFRFTTNTRSVCMNSNAFCLESPGFNDEEKIENVDQAFEKYITALNRAMGTKTCFYSVELDVFVANIIENELDADNFTREMDEGYERVSRMLKFCKFLGPIELISATLMFAKRLDPTPPHPFFAHISHWFKVRAVEKKSRENTADIPWAKIKSWSTKTPGCLITLVIKLRKSLGMEPLTYPSLAKMISKICPDPSRIERKHFEDVMKIYGFETRMFNTYGRIIKRQRTKQQPVDVLYVHAEGRPHYFLITELKQ